MIKPLAHFLFTIFFCVSICLVNVFLLISFKDDIGQEEVTILCILEYKCSKSGYPNSRPTPRDKILRQNLIFSKTI